MGASETCIASPRLTPWSLVSSSAPSFTDPDDSVVISRRNAPRSKLGNILAILFCFWETEPGPPITCFPGIEPSASSRVCSGVAFETGSVAGSSVDRANWSASYSAVLTIASGVARFASELCPCSPKFAFAFVASADSSGYLVSPSGIANSSKSAIPGSNGAATASGEDWGVCSKASTLSFSQSIEGHSLSFADLSVANVSE